MSLKLGMQYSTFASYIGTIKHSPYISLYKPK